MSILSFPIIYPNPAVPFCLSGSWSFVNLRSPLVSLTPVPVRFSDLLFFHILHETFIITFMLLCNGDTYELVVLLRHLCLDSVHFSLPVLLAPWSLADHQVEDSSLGPRSIHVSLLLFCPSLSLDLFWLLWKTAVENFFKCLCS